MNLHGQTPEIAHHFFDLWQDSLESQFNRMLADHRPCHYAIDNGSGQIIWVPKHTPCWFEGQSGKLIIDTACGSRWLPALHNGPANPMQVRLTGSVGMEEPNLAVPGLSFPRRQAWPKLPVLELNLTDVPRADCCPLARVRIYTEELRVLRTAVQLMVKRVDEKSAERPFLQPASSAMEPIQEGGSEADGSGDSPAEAATPEPAQGSVESLQAPEPHVPAEGPHVKSRSASPVRGCSCFGFGSRRPSHVRMPNKAADRAPSQSLDEQPPSTPRASEKATMNRGGSGEQSVPETAASPGVNEDDSAMLFYHEPSLLNAHPSGAETPLDGNGMTEHRGREQRSQDDSAMAFDGPGDRSPGSSAVPPAPVDHIAGDPETGAQPLDSHEGPTPFTGNTGVTDNEDVPPSLAAAVREKAATGASLPALLMTTAQAVSLGGLRAAFSQSVPPGLDASAHRHPEDGDASESDFLDTARGPRGIYHDASRGAQQRAAQLNRPELVSLPIRPHVWDAARLVAESRAACKEVWAPGYDHSPGLSDSEEHPVAALKPASGPPVCQEPAEQDGQSPAIQQLPPPTSHNPFQLPAAAIQLQKPPAMDPETPADEQPAGVTLPAQPSLEFVTAAMSRLGSQNVFGQGIGRQGSMLPSESRKLAHVALRAKEMPEKSRHKSAIPGDILQMRQALGRFPETALVQPLQATQTARDVPKLPMQPALSLNDWTNAAVPQPELCPADQQAVPMLAAQRLPQGQKREDAGNYSNSDVEIDSPFASKSLPREGQQSLPKPISKYAGTSDIIYEDLNNPFDKYRGPPRARRNRTSGKGISSSSKGSRHSRSRSPRTPASSAQEPELAGSPVSCLSQSASASETPPQSTDASLSSSPAREGTAALHLTAPHARPAVPSLDLSTDNSKVAEGRPQAMSSQSEAPTEQVHPGAAAIGADSNPAELQQAAAPVTGFSEETEGALHALDVLQEGPQAPSSEPSSQRASEQGGQVLEAENDRSQGIISQPAAAAHELHTGEKDVVSSSSSTLSHLKEAEAAQCPALQGAGTPQSITQLDIQPAEQPPRSSEPVAAQHAQPGQAKDAQALMFIALPTTDATDEPRPADRLPTFGLSEPQAAVVPKHAQQAQGPSGPPEADIYYDAVAVQPELLPLASAAASSAVPAQARPSGQTGRSEAVHERAQRPKGLRDPELPVSNHASSSTESLGHVVGGANKGLTQRCIADASSAQSTAIEKNATVTLRVMRPKPVGIVAAAIAALGLSSHTGKASQESVRVCITPLTKALPRATVALDPEQMDATWYSSLLMTSATPARGPHQPPASNRAAAQRPDAREAPDRAAVAAARLAEAGRGAKHAACHPASPLSEAAAAVPSQGVVDAVPEPRTRQSALAATADREAELPEAAAAVATLLPGGASTAGLPVQDPPEVFSPSIQAFSARTMLRGPSAAATAQESSARDAQQSLDISAQMDAAASESAGTVQRLPWDKPDQAAAVITPANQARAAGMTSQQRIESLQQHSVAAAPAERAGSALLPSPRKPRRERLDRASAVATLGGGATLARRASDAAQQAQRNRALIGELKQHLQTIGPRPSAVPTTLKRKLSSQAPMKAGDSPHVRGLLYNPELHSVADRVRHIERASSRDVVPISTLTIQSSVSHLPATCQPATLQEAA